METLQQKFNTLQAQMHTSINENGVLHETTIAISQALDNVVVEMQKLKIKEIEK